ncbi:glycosyltransferase [Candidatus Parcubacteria bacterium]|nr:glycosyltransferase [Candidatus Parcubacteria bacterium]
MLIEFCLPVYNEEKILKNNILQLLRYLEQQQFSFFWKIIILNNGSTDSTNKICRELASEKIKTKYIKNSGKGRAIKAYGLKSQADILVYMDIDLAVSLYNIPCLIKPIIQEEFDLVIGSRLLPNSKTARSFLRSFSSKVYNLLSKIILRHNLSDLQCGFKAIKVNKFKQLIPYIQNNKWFFDTELIAFANHFGCKIKEIPVDWQENRYEARKSKINLVSDSIKFMINLIKLKQRILSLQKFYTNHKNPKSD